MINVDLTKEEIAVVIGSILVAERTMPDEVVNIAIGLVDKLGDALETVGI